MARILRIKIVCAILVIAVAQACVLPALWFLKIRPDLLLITAVLLALNIRELPQVVIFSLFCGLLKDIFGIRLFGFNMLMFGFYAVCVYFILGYLYRETGWIEFIFLFCATLAHYAILSVILHRPYIAIGIIEAAMNCLLMPLAAKCLQPVIASRQPKHNRRGV